ncbi:MAG TPA: RQC domain-containing protein, partial [Roseomonas sp.]|nr:RQC domain-containing protein [Roseomonas sp.]
SWYQEIGRAGRDGLPARALLMFGAGDMAIARHRIAESPASDDQKRVERSRLDAMIAIAEAATCRRALLLRCFGEEPSTAECGACDVCRTPPRLFDGTVPAQKMLSAVVRTGQRFGVGHVVDVLRGRLTDKVAQFAHDKLPTFGIGKDVSDSVWRGIARQLVARGVLDVAVENHGELVATEAARPVLRGAEAVMLRQDTVQASPKRGSSAPSPVASGDPVFDALRGWRRGVAQAQGVPAYVVADDRTLGGIAAQRPGSVEALLEVPGMGRSRVERYGDDILRIVREAG